MAKVLRVMPKDLHILLEVSMTNVKGLSAILKRASITPETDLELAGADYLENILEPLLDELVEEYGNAS